MEISIRDILARIKVPGVREANIRHEVAAAITDITGITVTPSQVTYTEGNLALNVPPVMKSALLLRMNELKTRLREAGIEVTGLR